MDMREHRLVYGGTVGYYWDITQGYLQCQNFNCAVGGILYIDLLADKQKAEFGLNILKMIKSMRSCSCFFC